MSKYVLGLAVFAVVATAGHVSAQDRETKVRNDRKEILADGTWIYNDLPKGIAEAKRTGKPLLIVFRCIPCEACAQLDAQVAERDPVVRGLMEKFVCVRIVHANGMDLSLFQFDYDQSFAAFFMNADLTIYGRFGTRSHQTESENDVSIEGFAEALGGALELHKNFAEVRESLLAKQGAPSAVKVPEDFPWLKERFGSKLDYEGNVVRSCIHCHQVGESLRLVFRNAKQPAPVKVIYPWPNPKSLGLVMDPKHKARVLAVTAGTQAEADGFRVGDDILTLQGQPMLSIADMQWILHNAGESDVLQAEVERDGKTLRLPITLKTGWRQQGEISWRATSWDVRRMATGGLVLEDLGDEDRHELGIPSERLALRVKRVGQYGQHAVGKRAGFKKDDIITEFADQTKRMSEGDLLAFVLAQKPAGERVPVTVRRGSKLIRLTLPLQ